ncbi:MAG TPA: serine/threonine-protein kinase, partial [Methylomirabilota bacterium]|nr:serine/threonine-protein kinase [Methylomirabilota bacterium]
SAGGRVTLDRFEILDELGGGAMGLVLLGRDPATEQKIAIKMLRTEWLGDTRVREQFRSEAHHMQRLNHPHILKVLHVGDDPANPYLVTPYLDKGSLSSWITPGTPLNPELTLRVTIQTARALEYAHTHWIAHRDLKPDNVLLDAYSQVQVTDFGLAARFDATARGAARHAFEGTAPFMSPALAAGEREDTLADIYALGAMLYEMLTGHLPFYGETMEEITERILAGPPKPVLELNHHAPPGLVAICNTAMARQPRQRYPTMSALLVDLERTRRGDPVRGLEAARPTRSRWWAGWFRTGGP